MVNKFVFNLKTSDIVVKLRARHLFKIYRVYVEIIRLGLIDGRDFSNTNSLTWQKLYKAEPNDFYTSFDMFKSCTSIK